ncbi:hypothetical protein BJ508DRAFT_333536 [Ascobolus immersus RN42]|uniref:F-box domain-containing protein n=1 Tax=Ascobolus immersus RN42 TaxID=1160509 RepID=A0A3N4HJB9_ASCIM|nr:hypothetical protein BJ508DRAFT_333536 [Ascobolus immersus RN42]
MAETKNGDSPNSTKDDIPMLTSVVVSGIFSLPVELRLDIYDHCTILSLFILTHTCRSLYNEINTRKSLVRQAEDYDKYATNPWVTNNLIHHPMLPEGKVPLTIPIMSYRDKLSDFVLWRESSWKEVDVFNATYGLEDVSSWRCCLQLPDSRFLRLPLEIRLEVYSHCGLLTLLFLTHTCRTMYTDINTSPGIVKLPNTNDYAYYNDLERLQSILQTDHPMLPDGKVPLIIPMLISRTIDCWFDYTTGLLLLDPLISSRSKSEISTFNSVYGLKSDGKGWTCCQGCGMVRESWDFPADFASRLDEENCRVCKHYEAKAKKMLLMQPPNSQPRARVLQMCLRIGKWLRKIPFFARKHTSSPDPESCHALNGNRNSIIAEADKGLPDHSAFLLLPLEIRLEVYSHCGLLALFLLTHTCHTIYTDINNRKSLVQRSKGYKIVIAECQLHQPGSETMMHHTMLQEDRIPLTIEMMHKGGDRFDKAPCTAPKRPKEVCLFNEIHGHGLNRKNNGWNWHGPKSEVPPFLRLPLEMRLEIYSHCSMLNLLILTHTCRTFYTDINTRPDIIASGSPYDSPDYRAEVRRELTGHTTSHIMLPAGVKPLTIPFIAFGVFERLEEEVYDSEHEVYCGDYCSLLEYSLFNRVYGQKKSPKYGAVYWWACEDCCSVMTTKHYPWLYETGFEAYISGRNKIPLQATQCHDCYENDHPSYNAPIRRW